jgi:predicted nucleic acid-binding protein
LSEKWVVDASSLIILGKLSLLHLLTHLSDELIIPEGVAAEVLKGPRNDKAKTWMKKEGKNHKKNIGPINLNIASWDLGPGEDEVISYCYSNPQCTAIIDDKAAKKCAKTFSIKVKGTLAVLMMAKKKELIPEVRPILDQMIGAGFRIKSNLYQKILEIINE